MGDFAPSLREWVGSSKAMALRIWAISAAWVFILVRYACPGWEWVPSNAIAWGRMLAGCFLHVFGEFHGGYSCLQRKGNKQHEEKDEFAHAYEYGRIYMLIFSLEFPASGLGFPQHPRGPPSRRPTKRVGIWAWHVFVEARPWTWFPQHTRTSLSVTHQNRVCPVSV